MDFTDQIIFNLSFSLMCQDCVFAEIAHLVRLAEGSIPARENPERTDLLSRSRLYNKSDYSVLHYGCYPEPTQPITRIKGSNRWYQHFSIAVVG